MNKSRKLVKYGYRYLLVTGVVDYIISLELKKSPFIFYYFTVIEKKQLNKGTPVFISVFPIHISFHADPDPRSQKCPYGSGTGSRPLIFYSDPDPDPRGIKDK